MARALPLADAQRLEQAAPQPSPALAQRVLDGVARQRRQRRDRVRRRAVLGAAAALVVAAAIVGAVLLLPGGSGGTEVAFPTTNGAAAHATLHGNSAGTVVSFHVEGLRDGAYYWLWLTGDEGHRVGAGTFRGTPTPVDLTLTAAIKLGDTRRIWVTDKRDNVVLDTRVAGADARPPKGSTSIDG